MDDEQPVEEVEDQQEVAQDPEPEADAQPEQEAQPEPEADPEPQAQPEVEADPEPQAQPEVEAEPAPEVEEVPPQQEVPEVKEEPQAAPAEAYNGDLPADITSACDILYSDNPSFNWLLTKLTDAKKGKDGLVVDSVGTGGLNELKEKLKGNKSDIMFFLLRVNTYDNEGSSRAKFIYGRFMGTGVKFMQKAKLTPKLGEIADEFQVKHLSRDADEDMKDWDPETLGKEFLRIGGAHKPSKYDFGPNAVYDV